MAKVFTVSTHGKGLYEITDEISAYVSERELESGLCTVFVRHTSASLIIQENADPSVRTDLEMWLEKNVPENDPRYTHTTEGADDMPAHIRSAITATTLGIPVVDGRLALGTWQGIYLWEHRRRTHRREIVIQLTEGL